MRRADAAAQRYQELTAGLSLVRLVQPLDLQRHRRCFLDGWQDGTPANPCFDYADAPADPAVAELRRFCAESLDSDRLGDPWHRLIAAEARRFLSCYEACATRDAARVTEATTHENGVPDQETLDEAAAILREPVRPRNPGGPGHADPDTPLLDANQVAAVMSEVLTRQGLEDWTVLIDREMAARLSVDAGSRRIKVNAGAHLAADELERLVAHEIGTHVFRSVNASRGPALLTVTLSGHTATEEGLAIWNELRLAPDAGPDRRTALRVLAVDTALRGSFVDVVRTLEPFVPVAEAFAAAVRVKRGLTDTSQPGCFAKDHVYLAGFRAVARHLAQRPDDHALLMAAKWPLSHLDLLRETDILGALGSRLLRPDREFAALTRQAVDRICA